MSSEDFAPIDFTEIESTQEKEQQDKFQQLYQLNLNDKVENKNGLSGCIIIELCIFVDESVKSDIAI